MTEAEWNTCTDPTPMLEFLRGKTSDRKLRLFAVGCCRQVWKNLTLKPVRRAVETSEHYAAGSTTDQELDSAHRKGIVAFTRTFHQNVAKMADAAYAMKIDRIAFAVDLTPAPFQIERLDRLGRDEVLTACSPVLLRCIFGPLAFRPVTLDPAWTTFTVTQLAETIYQERGFDRLPILADALSDAGCDNQGLLNHCRQPGVHARGCFVIDLLLGKE